MFVFLLDETKGKFGFKKGQKKWNLTKWLQSIILLIKM